MPGRAYAVLAGTLIAIDRVAADRPFYSGKHKRHGMNLQVIASPSGDILRVSGCSPSPTRVTRAARTPRSRTGERTNRNHRKKRTAPMRSSAPPGEQAGGPGRNRDYTELDRSHGRVIRRSIWVTDAGEMDFPQARRVARIRRDRYDRDGQLLGKEIVHAVTSLGAEKASAEALAGIARGQWGIESVHWVRDTAYDEDGNTGYTGNGPQVMATLRNLAVSLLYLAGVKQVNRTLQAIARDRTRLLDYLPL
jgi:hypothetical protein